MDSNLRLAWTQIVSGQDYDEHMAAVGQAQASAALTAELLMRTKLRAGSRIVIAGAGTGQMLPPSLATALNRGQPGLVPHDELLSAFEARGYPCAFIDNREVADAKRLVSRLFVDQARC